MGDVYRPGWQAKEYHKMSRTHRADIAREVDRIFIARTGVTRTLEATSKADLELRRTWLRIRDEVMDNEMQKEIDDMRRDSVITDIPYEMLSDFKPPWKEASELLETWLERPPAIAPSYSAPVTNVIKMDWVLTFSRAKTVYDKIFSEKIWTNEASQKRMAELLRKKPRATGERWGDLSKAVTDVDAEWINSRSVTNGAAYDGMTGALGAFNLHVAIAGKIVAMSGSEFQVSVEEVGIYVKDSFDFEGEQFLGIWGYHDEGFSNSDFRKWRTDNHLGGDFLVFSDIKRTKLTSPDLVKGKL